MRVSQSSKMIRRIKKKAQFLFEEITILWHSTFFSSSDVLHVCHFCGFCSETLESVRSQVNRCKKFGLKPMQILDKFVDDVVGKHENGGVNDSSSSRSSRHRKSDASKCGECGISFASNAELVLHMEKIKCKSIQVNHLSWLSGIGD